MLYSAVMNEPKRLVLGGILSEPEGQIEELRAASL